MKKFVCILLAVVLVFALVGCDSRGSGDVTEPVQTDNATVESQGVESTSQVETTEPIDTEPVQTEKTDGDVFIVDGLLEIPAPCDISNADDLLPIYSVGWLYNETDWSGNPLPALRSIIEVENTSDGYIELGYYDWWIYSDNGEVIGNTSSGAMVVPSILAPGEHGFIYCSGRIYGDDIDQLGGSCTVTARPTSKPVDNGMVRYDVSQIEFVKSDTAPFKGSYVITNNTSEDAYPVYAIIVFKNSKGQPIMVYKNAFIVNLEIKAGESELVEYKDPWDCDDFDFDEAVVIEIYAMVR